jgi:serine/threonine protein kinase
MSRRFLCPKGHTWQADVPDTPGDSTIVLPMCPACGEAGKPIPSGSGKQRVKDPTSRLDSDALIIPAGAANAADPYSPPELAGYQIQEEIGRGGMGIVYRATDIKRGGEVAIKCLPRLDPNKLLRFKQEFRAVVDLSHPNLAAVYELLNVGGRWCLVMEHIGGVPFTDYFQSIPDFGERVERLRPAMRQLVDALSFLHETGLLHCDVKPSNVLVTRDERVVLLDFGLVTEVRPDPYGGAGGELVGSLGYIAPERFAGKPPTGAVDWYSVGVMLFETFAGRRPFEGTRTNLIWQQRYMDPPAPSEVEAEVPVGWDQLCVGLLDREPAHRLGRDDLLTFLDGTAPRPKAIGASLRLRDVPLVGRDLPLAELHASLEAAENGRPALAVVSGRTGMGKSTLVDRFLERVARRGKATILRGRCYEQESVPYKGLDGLIDALCEYLNDLGSADFQRMLPNDMSSLARMFPVLRRLRLGAAHWKGEEADPAETRRRAVSALLELLTRIARTGPLILAIDDLQWGDAESARLLQELLGGSSPPPALWLVCCRSEGDENAPCLQALRNVNRDVVTFTGIELGPLTMLEATSLAESLLAADANIGEAVCARIARESRGWPVFVHELCDYVRAAGANRAPGQSLSLDIVIQSRLQLLPDEGRRAVELLAVAGQPLREAALIQAAELPGEPRSALTLLRAGHWIRALEFDGDPWFECFHDTIRDAAVRHLSAGDLSDRHDRLARAFAALQPSEHVLLAVHHLGAGRPGEAAKQYARAAEEAEEALAFERAAQLLRLSLDLGSWPDDEARRMWHRLGDTLALAGRGHEAAGAYRSAARGADRTRASVLRRKEAFHLCASGNLEQGLAALRDVLRADGQSLPDSPRAAILALVGERLRLWWRGLRYAERPVGEVSADDLEHIDICWSATAGLSMFDVLAGAVFQARHLRFALNAGEPVRLARAFAWQAAHTSAAGPCSAFRVEPLLARARALTERQTQPHAKALLLLAEGIVAFNMGRWSAARDSLLQAEEQFRTRCRGVTWERNVVATFLFWSLYQLGEFAELAALAGTLLKQAHDRGDRLAATNVALSAYPVVRLAADDPVGARQVVRKHLDEWPHDRFHLQHVMGLLSELRIDLYEGKFDEARRRLRETEPQVRAAGFHRLEAVHTSLAYYGGMLEAGTNPSAALRAASTLERQRSPSTSALARLLRAAAAPAEARRDLLREAAKALSLASMRGAEAAARLALRNHGGDAAEVMEAGEWLRSRGVAEPARMAQVLVPALISPS